MSVLCQNIMYLPPLFVVLMLIFAVVLSCRINVCKRAVYVITFTSSTSLIIKWA